MWNTEDRISCCGNRAAFNYNHRKLHTTGKEKEKVVQHQISIFTGFLLNFAKEMMITLFSEINKSV